MPRWGSLEVKYFFCFSQSVQKQVLHSFAPHFPPKENSSHHSGKLRRALFAAFGLGVKALFRLKLVAQTGACLSRKEFWGGIWDCTRISWMGDNYLILGWSGEEIMFSPITRQKKVSLKYEFLTLWIQGRWMDVGISIDGMVWAWGF